MRPPIPNIALSRRAKAGLWSVAVLIVLIIALVQFAGVYINWLWFGSLGYRSIYTKIFWTRVTLFFIFGVTMALVIGGNLIVAYQLRPPFRPMSTEQQNIERYRVMLEPRRVLLVGVISAIALLSAGLSAQGKWATWQLFLHGGSFGITDPQFHKDISFYAWDYPAYRLLLGFGFSAVLFSIFLSAGVHYLSGAIRLQTPGPKVTLAARRHLTALVFVFILLKAIAYWLDRYGLVFSDRSTFTGASYADVHAALPARTILFWIAIIIAATVLASIWMRSSLIPGIAFISMIVLSILISGIYPAILQQVSVKPNASSKEAPYIRRNIEATRAAYGIQTGTNVTYKTYRADETPSTSYLQATDNATLNNVRILDPNVISQTVSKFQQRTNVYGFAPKLDVDRYTVNGVERDYIVGVRELDANNLVGSQTNWINEHTNYTHGYGFVAAQASKDITNEGSRPDAFAAGGIPTKPKTGPLALRNPGIYYGELMPDYSIVGAAGTPAEYNGDGTTKVTYQGGGGVPLSDLFKRLAFALHYKQGNFVLNDAAKAKGAKLIFNRDPRTMVQKVAPFLKVDGDPYPIVDKRTGDVVWIVDGYTTMSNYPYSQRQSLSSLTNDSLAATNKTARQPNDTVNYIRNSVKATVDAYTGKVTLYDWDPADPVLNAWRSIFPGLIKDKTLIPQDISAHIRYPEDLFEVQRAMLAQYHVSNPVTFYNVGNKWTVPQDPSNATNASQPPYYVLAAPPTDQNSSGSEFQLTSPMNVNNSQYLAAYISANSDPGDYGKLTVLQLPRGANTVQGPEQVFNKIATNTVISKDLTLFNTPSGGSSVVHGNLLTLPLGNSFLYVEPLYTQSSGSGGGTYPVLVRVIVVYGERVGYGETFAQAISDFAPGSGGTGSTLPGNSVNNTPSNPPTTTSPPSSSSTSQSSGSTGSGNGSVTLSQLNSAYSGLQSAIAGGNLSTIGAAQEKVRDLLGRYLAQSSSSPATSSGSASPSK